MGPEMDRAALASCTGGRNFCREGRHVARIAVGGLAHETNTFSTLPTRLDDFRRRRGADLVSGPAWDELRARGHELLPLFAAHAAPSGKVERHAFEALLSELIEGLRASLPLDGVLLELHGAMEVEEIGDGETAILRAVREVVGEGVVIAASLDLHANLAPAVVREAGIIAAFRTAPHRDDALTVERTASVLGRALEDGVAPKSHMVKLPLLVSGEAAVTEAEPARTLYGTLPAIDRVPGVLCSSILIGCAWTDSPFSTVSVLLSGTDGEVLRREANGLAREIWRRRSEFRIDSPTAEPGDAIRRALASAIRPVFISDSGDNPTAGAAGDSPLMLELLVRAGARAALVAGVADAEAVERCSVAGVGASVDLEVGGKLDAVFARPYACRARVVRLVGAGTERSALVETGGVHLVLQCGRQPFTELADFTSLGIAPGEYQLVVVKLGYLFPDLRDYAPAHIMALSQGFADQRLDRLPYRHLPRPVYPLDLDARWEAEGQGS